MMTMMTNTKMMTMTKNTRSQAKKKGSLSYWFLLTMSVLSTFWGAHWIANTASITDIATNDEEQVVRLVSRQARNQPVTRSRSSR